MIKLPLKPAELNEQVIMGNLPAVLSAFAANVSKIQRLYEVYMNQHDILNKKRVFEDQDVNNIVIEPHLYQQVEFKKGYIYGNAIEYAQKAIKSEHPEANDDMSYFGLYVDDVCLPSVNMNVGEWVHATGVGYFFIQPRTDKFDVMTEAPFKVIHVKSDRAVKVYSSYIEEDELFDVVLTPIGDMTLQQITDGDEKVVTKYNVMVYTHDFTYEYECGGYFGAPTYIKKTQTVYKELPLVEKYSHVRRFGLVELGLSLQNAIDKLSSDEMDNIDDIVNQIFAFINCSLGDQTFAEMKKDGAIMLKTINPQFPVDVKQLTTALKNKDTNIKYESLLTVLYDSAGVPRASGNVTSGGDTGQARMLGNGWEHAYIIAGNEIKNLVIADRKLLRKMLAICHATPDCPVNRLMASEIEIKYNIVRNDNLLIKTQSLQNLHDMNFPKEEALTIVGITSDPYSLSRKWENQTEAADETIEVDYNKIGATPPVKAAGNIQNA